MAGASLEDDDAFWAEMYADEDQTTKSLQAGQQQSASLIKGPECEPTDNAMMDLAALGVRLEDLPPNDPIRLEIEAKMRASANPGAAQQPPQASPVRRQIPGAPPTSQTPFTLGRPQTAPPPPPPTNPSVLQRPPQGLVPLSASSMQMARPAQQQSSAVNLLPASSLNSAGNPPMSSFGTMQQQPAVGGGLDLGSAFGNDQQRLQLMMLMQQRQQQQQRWPASGAVTQQTGSVMNNAPPQHQNLQQQLNLASHLPSASQTQDNSMLQYPPQQQSERRVMLTPAGHAPPLRPAGPSPPRFWAVRPSSRDAFTVAVLNGGFWPVINETAFQGLKTLMPEILQQGSPEAYLFFSCGGESGVMGYARVKSGLDEAAAKQFSLLRSKGKSLPEFAAASEENSQRVFMLDVDERVRQVVALNRRSACLQIFELDMLRQMHHTGRVGEKLVDGEELPPQLGKAMLEKLKMKIANEAASLPQPCVIPKAFLPFDPSEMTSDTQEQPPEEPPRNGEVSGPGKDVQPSTMLEPTLNGQTPGENNDGALLEKVLANAEKDIRLNALEESCINAPLPGTAQTAAASTEDASSAATLAAVTLAVTGKPSSDQTDPPRGGALGLWRLFKDGSRAVYDCLATRAHADIDTALNKTDKQPANTMADDDVSELSAPPPLQISGSKKRKSSSSSVASSESRSRSTHKNGNNDTDAYQEENEAHKGKGVKKKRRRSDSSVAAEDSDYEKRHHHRKHKKSRRTKKHERRDSTADDTWSRGRDRKLSHQTHHHETMPDGRHLRDSHQAHPGRHDGGAAPKSRPHSRDRLDNTGRHAQTRRQNTGRSRRESDFSHADSRLRKRVMSANEPDHTSHENRRPLPPPRRKDSGIVLKSAKEAEAEAAAAAAAHRRHRPESDRKAEGYSQYMRSGGRQQADADRRGARNWWAGDQRTYHQAAPPTHDRHPRPDSHSRRQAHPPQPAADYWKPRERKRRRSRSLDSTDLGLFPA